jgi:hypothetical protein
MRWPRRRFLLRAAATALAAGGGACGEGRRGAARREEIERPDTHELWPAEIRTRTDNEYVDRSTKSDQFCFHCTNFVPGPDPRSCGSCRTVKGPIDPGGWCKAWTEARS